ncbi:glycosyltransferase family 2 protein [Nostoc sp. FACHB-152]|uniref:glycosyltransferase family 2 protein n=1 Tax=unclassified Nostoc TaxID=2593658 RepID=UPI0016894BBC|nr:MULTISPECIES: glycosyltransferase family A protein [unclassified Nostoc]MBD2449484.1 glycosyltransferase family 2 protein [Nostoc sp. FACHB-152]MBD2470299.1 glycosyltransferase family 2 protein [Nostoc sp. FACHB-145]
MPKISVIIPAYNAECTIGETIQSVQQQTFQDFELIIIDDGSKDKTLEIIQSINDKRLKIFAYENGGVAEARNRGISHANAEYIAFLDADDLWTPDKLELQLVALQKNPEVGVAYSWTSYFSDSPKKVLYPGKSVHFSGDVYAQLLVNNFLASGSNPLICRKVIESVGKFDPTCTPCEDWDFYLRLAARSSFVVVPKHQILYRQSSNSGSSKMKAVEKAGLLTIQKAYQVAPPKLQYLRHQSLAWFYQYCTQQYLKQDVNNIDAVNQASQKLWTAIRLHPQILLQDYAQSLIRWLIKKWIITLVQQVRVAKSKILLFSSKN